MKQNITEEQLNELSDDALIAYSKWMEERNYKTIIMPPNEDIHVQTINIGQMIEFLEEDHLKHSPSNLEIVYSSSLLTWWYKNGKQYRELCDALWEAVKEVLSEEHDK